LDCFEKQAVFAELELSTAEFRIMILLLSVDGLGGGVYMPRESGSKLREVFLEGD